MKNWTLALALGTAVATTAIGLEANPASAGTFTWDVSFTIEELGEKVVAQFVTDNMLTTDIDTGFEGFKVQSLTGTQDGNTISLLYPGTFGPNGYLNNNLFNPFNLTPSTEDVVDIKGVAYEETATGEKYQLFYQNGLKGCPENCGNTTPQSPYTIKNFKATLVPEPTSTFGFLALGTLGAASTLKRKLKPAKPVEKDTEKVG